MLHYVIVDLFQMQYILSIHSQSGAIHHPPHYAKCKYYHNFSLKNYYKQSEVDFEKVLSETLRQAKTIKTMIIDVVDELHQQMNNSENDKYADTDMQVIVLIWIPV